MSVKFYSLHLSEIHPFYVGLVKMWKILFANDHKINKLIDSTKKLKTNNMKLMFVILMFAMFAQCLQKIAILQ